MQYKELIKRVNETPFFDFGEFGKGCSLEWITKAQERLKVKFPPSYIWWLETFRGGSIHGEEIYSIYEMDFDKVVGGDIVYVNELNWKNGLNDSNELVIQENDQGEVYFFDLTTNDATNEYSVKRKGASGIYANNFIDFLIKKSLE